MTTKKIKSIIMLIVLLFTITISTAFADTRTGYFYINGQWMYGTVESETIINFDGYIAVGPPWQFIGHDSNGTPITVVGFTSEKIPGPLDYLPSAYGNIITEDDFLNLNNKNAVSGLNNYFENEIIIKYNYTDEVLQITSDSNSIDIDLFDLNGKNVYSIKNSNTTTISTKDLPQAEGAYILKITSNGQSATKKIILSNGKCYFSSEK